MTAMNIFMYSSMLPHDEPVASLAFYRDTLGFEVRNDVEYGGMHWFTVGPADHCAFRDPAGNLIRIQELS
jgi:catechol 2,3-dioxygenase-like lactoylglutathione lyase family enzyme